MGSNADPLPAHLQAVASKVQIGPTTSSANWAGGLAQAYSSTARPIKALLHQSAKDALGARRSRLTQEDKQPSAPPVADEDPGPFSGRARLGGERSPEARRGYRRRGARWSPGLGRGARLGRRRGGRPPADRRRAKRRGGGAPGKYAGRVFGLMVASGEGRRAVGIGRSSSAAVGRGGPSSPPPPQPFEPRVA